jgi:spore germination protein YaaH
LAHPGRRPARLFVRLGPAVLVAVLALWPVAAIGHAAAPHPTPIPGPADRLTAPSASDAPADPELHPSIHYEDTVTHAGDVIAFVPGDRVATAFVPRADDSWAVDGGRPRALPAGQVSGRQMVGARQGSIWTASPPDGLAAAGLEAAGVDQPIDSALGPTIRATSAAFVAGDPATGRPAVSQAAVGTTGLRREVFGFLPYWEVSDSSTTLDWSVLSTVAYFSVGTDAAGNLLKQDPDGSATTGWGGWTSSKMTSVINAAHAHGTRVVLTISCFAWTTGQQTTQATLLDSPAARTNLARQVAAAVRDRGADGVNLDFEPIVSGRADEFTAFVRSVRAELDAIAPGYQLTFDTTGYIGNYPLEDATAPGAADAIFIMGYDYRGSSSSSAGSISPLTGPVYDLTDTLIAYTTRVSPSKLILGVPYYGRAWSTSSDAPHAANISGSQYGTSVTAVYTTAADLAAQYGRRYDGIEQAPWTAYQRTTCTTTYGCATAWRELYYDDAASLRLRYDLVNQAGLRGAGIWALGYDGTRPELYAALADKFIVHVGSSRLSGPDRFATAAAISAATFSPGVPVAYVATGYNFPDALAGAAVAGLQGAPILLVAPTSVPSSTATELARLKPARIVILGGPGAVGDIVVGLLSPYTTEGVFRYAGSDRFATAAAISAATFSPGVPVAYVATGYNFPDALAGAAVAGLQGAPILLVAPTSVPSSTATELARLKPARIVILGGPGVVSDAVLAAAVAAAGG